MGRFRTVTYVVIGLAAVGLFSQLFKNPLGIVKWLFITAIIAAVIIAAIHLFIRKSNQSSNEMRKYQKALKQSKRKYNPQQKSNRRPQNKMKHRKKRRRPTHLRVIQGKKSKNEKSKNENRAN